jgi:hypothetical protein
MVYNLAHHTWLQERGEWAEFTLYVQKVEYFVLQNFYAGREPALDGLGTRACSLRIISRI